MPVALFSDLKSKIEKKQAGVAVIGLGYVGLPLALLYTEQKFSVTGFEIDARKVSILDQGDLQMKCAPLENLGQYDCALIVTDHSDYDYARIVRESQLVVDTRNATKGIKSPKIVHC
jgi:UDP-N-acetyl-D-mannosaminuronate dehydrogenase